MSCMTRCIFRWGLISALALGGATLLIGPERVAAGLTHARAKVQSLVDRAVDDPTALRRQLEELASAYPQRIATVRGEIAEVNQQIGQFEEDGEIARRVVAMTTDDLHELKELIARARDVRGSEGGPVYVRFEGVRFNLDSALSEARRINNVRVTYEDRLSNSHQQLTVLEQQKARLVEILTRLEDEYSTFETKMWQLDRQIDTIDRNERLIEMTKQLQATLEGYERLGKLDNLKQLEAKLAELQTIQEAQLETLRKMGVHDDYEKRARYELETGESAETDPFEGIEETDDDAGSEEEAGESADSFAWLNGPRIIE